MEKKKFIHIRITLDELLTSSWPVDLGRDATLTTLQRRCANPPAIPVSRDVHVIFGEATLLVQRYTTILESHVTPLNFVRLNEGLLVALALCNGRRSSQLTGAPFECFRSRPAGDALQRELRVVPLLDRAVGVTPAGLDDHQRRPEFFMVPGGKNKRPVAVIV